MAQTVEAKLLKKFNDSQGVACTQIEITTLKGVTKIITIKKSDIVLEHPETKTCLVKKEAVNVYLS